MNPQEKQYKYSRGQSAYRGPSSSSSWKRCIYKKLSRQNEQKQGLCLQEDQQVKKPMNQVAQISKHLDKWQTITKDSFILDIVKISYTIEFTDLPRQQSVDSPKMQTVIEELILKQAISVVETQNLRIPGFYNRLFLVDKKTGGGGGFTTSSRDKQIEHFVANE